MRKFDAWAHKIFACHRVVLRKKMLSEQNVELTIETMGGLTIYFPLLMLCFLPIAIVPEHVEAIKPFLLVAILVIVFGGSKVTDRIYRDGVYEIKRLSFDFANDPEKGKSWAARQLLGVYFASIIALSIVFLLIRLIVQ